MLLYRALEKDVPSSLGWTTMQYIKSRMVHQTKGLRLSGGRGQIRVTVVVCCCCPHWWIMSVLPTLLRPVSPTPPKLWPGKAWRMELVSTCTHRHTDEAVWNPGRWDNGRGASGNQSCYASSPAHSGLEKCQGSPQQVVVLAVAHCISYWLSASSAGALAFWIGP